LVKEFWREATSDFVSLLRSEWSLVQLATIDDWMILSASYTEAETTNAFQQPKTQILSIPIGMQTIIIIIIIVVIIIIIIQFLMRHVLVG